MASCQVVSYIAVESGCPGKTILSHLISKKILVKCSATRLSDLLPTNITRFKSLLL